jgi:hypothetical protein
MGSSASKAIKVEAITGDTTYEDFESITLIDSAATDGFQIAGSDGVYAQVPTGIVVNVGGPGPRLCEKISIKATSGKSLACTVIIYK